MMTCTIPAAPNQRQMDAAFDALAFVRKNGAGLCTLIDALSAEDAFEALCYLHAQGESVAPNPDRVEDALMRIVTPLRDEKTSGIDAAARVARFEVDTALRWYGARLDDLLARFSKHTGP